MKFLLKEDINRLLLADDAASVKKAKIQRIINYGFGICSIYEQEKRDAIDQDLDKMINALSADEKKTVGSIKTNDTETALKRSLALMMVISRENVPKNPLKEADALMKTAHFNFLFSEIQDELIPTSAETSPDIKLPEKNKITDYNRRLATIISQNLAVPEDEIDANPKGLMEDRKSNRSLNSMKASISDSGNQSESSGRISVRSEKSSKVSHIKKSGSIGKQNRSSKPISRSK